MAEAAVTFLVENLRNLLVEEVSLISGAEREVQQLQLDLQLAKSFLQDLEMTGEKEEVLTQFERKIREVVYNAEDIFDDFLALQKSRPYMSFGRIANRIKFSKTIEAFRKDELLPLLERARSAMADLSATSPQQPRTKHQRDAELPSLREDNIVGFEDETELLIKYLKEESDELDVISIVGMPGLGKTTLARKIFLDPIIKFEFPTLIWIHVSQDFNIKDVYLSILKVFTSEDLSELTDSLLADIVRNTLENCRFLLIIDDVYSTEYWKRIGVALPKRNRYGKVLITTRDQKVAQQVNSKRNPHCLRPLTLQESWELLQLEVFGALDKCPSSLEGHGKKIAMDCDGLPLAIVVIGGILLEKLSTSHMIEEWEKVSSSLTTYLHLDDEKRMESIISSSYNRLPYELRDCFLYLGVFPVDTVIPTGKLVQLWIAEGFIQPILGKSLEEAAEDNLKDLADRNLVMVEETKAGGGIKTCRLHGMVHEFCRSRAAFEQRNLFQEVIKSREGGFHPPLSEIGKYRRLCIHSYVEDFVRQGPKGPRVRSFLCFSKVDIILRPAYVSAITKAFDCLRVLDVSPIKLPIFPSRVCRLIHLRYIALSGDNFKGLPDVIVKLWNLQTIRIDTLSRTLEIKADIWKIKTLRHLMTKAAIVINKEAEGEGGQNLQNLTRLSIQSFSEEICRRVFNLKNLGIRGNLDTLLNTNYMSRLDRLQKLKLLHDVYPRTASENPLVRLPSPEAFPPNMRILTLSSTYLEWKHMRILGMLPTLEILKLKDNAFVGNLWEDNGGLFPYLRVLLIDRTDLEFWSASEDSFPRLECVVLKNCQSLHEIPHVLAKSLQALDIERVSKSAVTSAEKIESMKKEMQDQQRAKRDGFKLRISPSDEI